MCTADERLFETKSGGLLFSYVSKAKQYEGLVLVALSGTTKVLSSNMDVMEGALWVQAESIDKVSDSMAETTKRK